MRDRGAGNTLLTTDPYALQAEGRAMESNARFYSRRAVQEAQAASRAVTEAARLRHLELAQRYSALASDQRQA